MLEKNKKQDGKCWRIKVILMAHICKIEISLKHKWVIMLNVVQWKPFLILVDSQDNTIKVKLHLHKYGEGMLLIQDLIKIKGRVFLMQTKMLTLTLSVNRPLFLPHSSKISTVLTSFFLFQLEQNHLAGPAMTSSFFGNNDSQIYKIMTFKWHFTLIYLVLDAKLQL